MYKSKDFNSDTGPMLVHSQTGTVPVSAGMSTHCMLIHIMVPRRGELWEARKEEKKKREEKVEEEKRGGGSRGGRRKT